MERIIVKEEASVFTNDVIFSDGVVVVYLDNRVIGSVVPFENSVRIVTLFEDTIVDDFNDLLDAFFDYVFKYITD